MSDERVPHDHRFRSGPPAIPAPGLPPVPDALAGLLAGAPAEQTWVKPESEVWLVELSSGRAYLKIMDDLGPWIDEIDRLGWCVDHSPLPTPHVLGKAVDERGRGWFVATEVAGTPSHDRALVQHDAASLVRGLATGLRRFHDGFGVLADSSPVDCPFRLGVDDLIVRAEARVAAGGVDPSQMLSVTYQRLSPERLLEQLVETRPEEPAADQVVTHGDPCQPNLLVDPTSPEEMQLTGLVDLGRLAVTDRYRDLAITARSLEMNLGTSAAAQFLETYGLDPLDEQRLGWWTLVDDMW